MANTRVYDLAKELGVESKTILRLLKEAGRFVRSASSEIDLPTQRILREKLRLSGQATPGRIHPDVLAPWPTNSRKPKRSPVRATDGPKPDEWAKRWFEPAQIREWQAVGVYDASVAERCLEHGLQPKDMTRRLDGRRVGEMLAGGGSIAVVMHLIAEEQRRAGSGDTG